MSNTATTRFSDRVANYIKYRPGYPDQAIQFLIRSAGLKESSRIADIGAGTGIFSKLLLDVGFTVDAVEPNQSMRQAAEELLYNYPGFHSVAGSAAQTQLPAQSVDLIVCAQAFHWFCNEYTWHEFKRILKPGGKVALIWNNRQVDVDEFSMAYELLLKQGDTDYNEVNHRNVTDAHFNAFFKNGKYTLTKYPNIQVFGEEGLVGRALSSSYPATETEAGRHFIAALKELFNLYQVNGSINFQYETEIYLGEI